MNYFSFYLYVLYSCLLFYNSLCDEIFGCGGFVKSNFSINYARVDIKLYTKQGSLKYQTDCAPNNGYYLIPLYDKGDYILKIEPPAGWTFEPDSVSLHVDGTTDPCSKNQDINFVFKGFSISGKVLSAGQKDGPTNIKLALKKSTGEILQETESTLNGVYQFSSILPDTYTIEASHSLWYFTRDSESIKVEQDNINAKNEIVVAGFDVRGYVFSEGEPIRGVHFLLFSKGKLKEIPSECQKDTVKGFNPRKELNYLCYVTSSKDGDFIFPSVPIGSYKLIPFHKSEHIEFDVSPPEVDFIVGQESYKFPENFQVQGFSVTGRILEVVDGVGVDAAEIYINNKYNTVTNRNGVYHLENMRAGTYELSIKTPHIFFDVVSVKVTPNTPQLPEIYASKFSICGNVRILTAELKSFSTERSISVTSFPGDSKSIITSRDGSFCFVGAPGTYTIEPVISDKEAEHGLLFNPTQRQVQLTHFPVLDVGFTQLLATLRGRIKCIEKCGNLVIRVFSLLDDDVTYDVTTTDDGRYEIKGCLPGKYFLTIEHDTWCFQSKKLEFTVVDKDLSGLNLRQSGFQVAIRLSHPSSFRVKYPSGELHSIHLEKAKNVLCLPESGSYDIIPIGCHLYKTDIYKVDTAKPAEIDVHPTKHLVTGNVFTEVNVSDIKVSIQKISSSVPEIIPLKEPVELRASVYRYVFSIFVEPHTELDIKVTSQQLLFHPAIAHIQVLDDCIDNAVEMVGKKGLFIDGGVKPVIQDVKISLLDKNLRNKVVEIMTDKNGNFHVGPLDGDLEYEIVAEKEGYFFTPQGAMGNFQAFKLAEIVVEVIKEDGSPLPGVLLSLSGGVDYRKNSLSQKNGKISFMGLNPGQYFLRPMLKEFQFEPPTKMIDIKEGTQVKVEISGKRVAFSLFGVVNSLTGEAEVGVAVEAVGIESENCLQYQEEAISEQGGTFRIRGLQPGCQYNLRLKQGPDVNQHIERATPEELLLNVGNSDITNVRIIAFRHFGQMDVSGSVSTKMEFLQTLKARLYCDDNPDQILHTITLGRSSFFFLPSMPIDKRSYTIRIDSTLSNSAYSYVSPMATFVANTSFFHFTFTFNPRPKVQDQEMTQGSILALPVAIIAIIFIYYYDKLITISIRLFEALSNFLTASPPNTESATTDVVSTRKKPKVRKLL